APSCEPPLDLLEVPLTALDPLAARARLDPLPEPEIELLHRPLEVPDERRALEWSPAPTAVEDPLSLEPGPLVHVDAHARRSLDHVEELTEGDEHQRQHD